MSSEEIELSMPWGTVALKCWNSRLHHPILVLHGVRMNAGSFDLLIPLLPDQFYYVCIDLPGHGLSDGFAPGLPASFMHFIHVLLRVVSHFNWKSYSLLAHSYMSNFAFTLASLHCDKIQRIICIDPAIRSGIAYFNESVDYELFWLTRGESYWTDQTPCSYDEALQKRVSGFDPLSIDAVKCLLSRYKGKIKNDYEESPFSRLFYTTIPFHDEEWTAIVRKVSCPVLILFANESPFKQIVGQACVQSDIVELLMRNRESQCVYVDGTHVVHLNHPERVAPIVTKFLNSTVGDSGLTSAKL